MSAVLSDSELLTDNDVVTLLEQLQPVQNKTYELGLKLKLPDYVVENIHKSVSNPQMRLLAVLIEFRKQREPRPTRRVIMDALRSPAVNLPQLASEVETAHFLGSLQIKVSKTSCKSYFDLFFTLSFSHTNLLLTVCSIIIVVPTSERPDLVLFPHISFWYLILFPAIIH